MRGDVFAQPFESKFRFSVADKLKCFLDIEPFIRCDFRQADFQCRIVQTETVFFGVVLCSFLFRSVTNQRRYQYLFFGIWFLNLFDGRKKFLVDVLQEFYVMNRLHHVQSRQAAFGNLVCNQPADTACQFFFRLLHKQVDGINAHFAVFETQQFLYFQVLFGR